MDQFEIGGDVLAEQPLRYFVSRGIKAADGVGVSFDSCPDHLQELCGHCNSAPPARSHSVAPGKTDGDAAADVQDPPAMRDAFLQAAHPWLVLAGGVVVATVVKGDRVVAEADHLGRIGVHEGQAIGCAGRR